MSDDVGFEVGAGFEEKGENGFGVELDAVMGGDRLWTKWVGWWW